MTLSCSDIHGADSNVPSPCRSVVSRMSRESLKDFSNADCFSCYGKFVVVCPSQPCTAVTIDCVVNVYAVSRCGQLRPEMLLLPTVTSHVPSIESEQYVGLCCRHIAYWPEC